MATTTKLYHVNRAPSSTDWRDRETGEIHADRRGAYRVEYFCDRGGRPWQGVKVKFFPTLAAAEAWAEIHGCECCGEGSR